MMKYQIWLVLLLVACGDETERTAECFQGCPDNEIVVLEGPAGPRGRDGANGEMGATGDIGAIGPVGPIGPAGAAGSLCAVVMTNYGAIIMCEDGTIAPIHNGEDGAPGEPGASGIVGVVDPCGQQREDGYDEVLLRLHSGELFANYYNHAKKQSGLVLIQPGTYTVTDGTDCVFTVTADNEVIW
jgi:hypothetical protein